MKLLKVVQSCQCRDANCADYYYTNRKKKNKIPALWVPLKFFEEAPVDKFFNFRDVKKSQNRHSSLPVHPSNSSQKIDPS